MSAPADPPLQMRSGPRGRSSQRIAAADQDWRPRTLHRQRLERHLVDSMMLAVERERLPTPEPGDNRKPLVQPLCADARVGFLPNMREAGIALVARAKADDQPALRELWRCQGGDVAAVVQIPEGNARGAVARGRSSV